MPGATLKTDAWICEYISPYDIYQRGITKFISHKQTEFQEMYIVETGTYGKVLVLDGKFQSTTVDEFLYHEPLVHPAMILHGAPKKVLIVGGGEGATAREILKWKSVEKVVMVDIDGVVVEECIKHLPELHQGAFDDPRTEFIVGDALAYMENTKEKFDVVISDLCDPLEDGPAADLFTKESYELVKSVMNPGGVFSLQGGPINPIEIQVHGNLNKTLQSVFKNVHSQSSYVAAYISLWGFIVASDNPIPKRIDIEAVDKVIAEMITKPLRMMDGTTLSGMFNTPKHLRDVIANSTRVYTRAAKPDMFGEGTMAKEDE